MEKRPLPQRAPDHAPPRQNNQGPGRVTVGGPRPKLEILRLAPLSCAHTIGDTIGALLDTSK